MQVFPGDDFTADQIDAMLIELESQHLVGRFDADGECYLVITGWHHQKIERPTYKYPAPPSDLQFVEDSPTTRRQLAERSPPEGNGEERSGEEGNGVDVCGVGDDSTIEREPMTGIVFPVDGDANRRKWQLPCRIVGTLSEAFPMLDVEAEARKAASWCELNPSKRKTARGMGKFLHGWMDRAMQKGGVMKPKQASSRIMTMEEAQNWSFD
jgi:hypothetical protein